MTVPHAAATTGRDDVRDGIIDAAERAFARFSLSRTSMADVAREAGVHRATLYRHFETRSELVLAVLLRECRPIIDRAAAVMTRADDIDEGIVTALVGAIGDLEHSERLAILFDADTAADTAQVATLSAEFVALAVAATRPAFERAEGLGVLRPGVDITDATNWLLRVAMSFLTDSPRLSRREQSRLLRTCVMPAFFVTD